MGKKSKKDEFPINVSVRVRPISQRETQFGTSSILLCGAKTVTVTDPKTSKTSEFRVTNTFYSFDPTSESFASQDVVYANKGPAILKDVWAGNNVALMAYGTSGSGKTHTLYGTDDAHGHGLQPRLAEKLFRKAETASEEGDDREFRFEVSMIEIYNERVRDLLNHKHNPISSPLEVLEHPNSDFYIEGVTETLCRSYEDFELLCKQATAIRTKAAVETNLTATRAHTITTIKVTRHKEDADTEKDESLVSTLMFVDIAGSENAKPSGEIREGQNINLSLTTLASVVKEVSKGNKFPAFGDSVLTKLLKPLFGGHFKTHVMASLSPSPDAYGQTIETLKTCEALGNIVNRPKVGKNADAKSLQSVKNRLKSLAKDIQEHGTAVGTSSDAADLAALKKESEQLERLKKTLQLSWEDKERNSDKSAEKRTKALNIDEQLERRKTVPHFVNLHPDESLSEALAYFCPEPGNQLRMCRANAEPPPDPAKGDIVLTGLQILKVHCIVKCNDEGDISVAAMPKARIFLNGQAVRKKAVKLKHNDRVLFGAHMFFRFVSPTHAGDANDDGMTLDLSTGDGGQSSRCKYNFEYAQKELSASAMKSLEGGDKSKKPKSAAELEMEASQQRAIKKLEMQGEKLKAMQRKSDRSKEQLRLEHDSNVQDQREKLDSALAVLQERLDAESDADAKAEYQQQMDNKTAAFEETKKELGEQFAAKVVELEEADKGLLQRIQTHKAKFNELVNKHSAEEREHVLMQERMMIVIPLVNEATAIASEMGIDVAYEVQLRVSEGAGGKNETTEVCVKGSDDKASLTWPHAEFVERVYEMRELYNAFIADTSGRFQPPSGPMNPFLLTATGPQLLGRARVYLQPCFFLLPIKVDTPIIDSTGAPFGMMKINVLPIPRHQADEDSDADSDDDDDDVKKGEDGGPTSPKNEDEQTDFFFDEDDAGKLMRKPLAMRVHVPKLMGVPINFGSRVCVKYAFYNTPEGIDEGVGDETLWASDVTTGAATENPVLNHTRVIEIEAVSPNFIEYLKNGLIEVQVWGQPPHDSEKTLMGGGGGGVEGGAANKAGGESGGNSRNQGGGGGGGVQAVKLDDEMLKSLMEGAAEGADAELARNFQSHLGALQSENEIMAKEKAALLETMKSERPSDYQRAKAETERVRKEEEMRVAFEKQTAALTALKAKADDADDLKKKVDKLKKKLKEADGGKSKKKDGDGDGGDDGDNGDEAAKKKLKEQLKKQTKALAETTSELEELKQRHEELMNSKSAACVIL